MIKLIKTMKLKIHCVRRK